MPRSLDTTLLSKMLRPSATCRCRWSWIAKCLLFVCWLEFGMLPKPTVAQGVAIGIEEDDEPPEDAAQRGALPRMTRQQMEEYMYGSLGGSKAAFHKLKRESIRRELDRVDSVCVLTEEQWGKLNGAIEIDIQHIENRITTLLSGYDGKMTPPLLQEMQQKVWQFASSIQTDKADKNAVWHKVLNSQLTKQQNEKIQLDDAKKAANRTRTDQLKSLLILQRKLGLTESQRVKIDEWLKQDANRGLDIPALCNKLVESADSHHLLRPAQIKALMESPVVLPMQLQAPRPLQAPVQLQRILPARILPALNDDPFK